MSNTVAQSLTFVGSYPENILLQALSTIEFGSIRIESPWGGHHHIIGKEKGPQAEIKILSADFYDELLKKGDIGLGETYMAGQWESPDIGALIQFGIVNQQTLKRAILGSWFRLLVYRLTRLTQINFKGNAKKNIHKHYDLGNDFYQMWLDPSMTYSSAYWGDQPLLNLQDAQQKKYESILQALHAKPGDHILEIGCGWGGFAEFAASKGMKVTGITISQAQFEFATQRMKTHNLSSLVDIQLVDYRDVNGQFDHVVSIEMIEAVGKEFWESYFLKIKEVTKKGGRVAIQSIVMNDGEFANYLNGTDFIQQYIFPGGVLLSPNTLKKFIQKISDQGQDKVISFGLDYARTLHLWNIQFQQAWPKIKTWKFDLKFKRMWEFYLKYCEGSFLSKKIDVLIVSFRV